MPSCLMPLQAFRGDDRAEGFGGGRKCRLSGHDFAGWAHKRAQIMAHAGR